MQASQPDRMLSAKQVAVMMGCSAHHITNQAKNGSLPANRIGKLWRFSEQQLLEYVKGDNRGQTKS